MPKCQMTNNEIQTTEIHDYKPTLNGMAVQLADIQEMINGVLDTGKRLTITNPPPRREQTEREFLELVADRILSVQMDLDTLQERIKTLL
ncbi:hypothetical protein [Rodentibacter haemolyticus]|uniref:Uncharacterized protein n=1 Tax=Rodentibacter haemolyticus TaxID=2778911 RepID=A0ABX6V2Z8_9PAST|nr:hypothetical protein [Rodentibacter haemolyticus]QPB42666.1 hypothetical protein IHV77_00625 [Rodentibacter haemolyticus]